MNNNPSFLVATSLQKVFQSDFSHTFNDMNSIYWGIFFILMLGKKI